MHKRNHRIDKFSKIFALTSIAFVSPHLWAQSDVTALKNEVKQLKKDIATLKSKRASSDRVASLEMTVEDIKDKLGNRAIVHAFEGQKVDIGGFMHTAYTSIEGEDGSAGSFDRQNFELLIGAEFTESWTAFFAGGFLRESDDPFANGSSTDPSFNSRNKTPQIISWTNYQRNDLLNVRIGRMITPHGIINITHFPATLYDPEQPQFLRPFSGNTIFPNFSTGVQVHGKHFGDAVNIEYATYAVNASQAASEEIYGGRFAIGSYDNSFTIGLNFSNSYRVVGPEGAKNTMTGVDLSLNVGILDFKAEYYATDEDLTYSDPSLSADREAYYVQPALNVADQWALFYRYDYLSKGDVLGESTENMFGVNYTPSFNIRLRLTYTQREFDVLTADIASFDSVEANILQLSGTFSF